MLLYFCFVSMIYKVALSLIKGLSVNLIEEIEKNYSNDQEVFNALKLLVKNPRNTKSERIKSQLKNDAILNLAEKIANNCLVNRIKIVAQKSHYYPKLLKECPDKPYLLYQKGNINPNDQELIAIVGTRSCTSYGLKNCEEIISQLKNYEIAIVSGLAYGIDIKAHSCANKNQVVNYGVLGSGIMNIYPKKHQNHAEEIMQNGMLITEFPPNTPPLGFHFPKRNRIIAGMAKSTIVIESAAKGGAIITGEIANSYNRDVFAIPGDIHKPYSKGCNHLIFKQKAHLLKSPTDLIEFLELTKTSEKRTMKQKPKINLTKNQSIIYNIIGEHEKINFNALQKTSNIKTTELMVLLLEMEIGNIIKELPGKIYRLL